MTVWYPAVSTAANDRLRRNAGRRLFPLVVRAHGFGAFRNDSADLAKHLASRGMIRGVAGLSAVEHQCYRAGPR